jgi:broad specificity phosphatase PhoE
MDEENIVLTDLGIMQAKHTGMYLRSLGVFDFEVIYSSDFSRTIDTADLIKHEMGINVPHIKSENLREQYTPPLLPNVR